MAVAVGTATYHNPVVMNEIIDALPDRMADLGIESIEDMIREVKEGRRLG